MNKPMTPILRIVRDIRLFQQMRSEDYSEENALYLLDLNAALCRLFALEGTVATQQQLYAAIAHLREVWEHKAPPVPTYSEEPDGECFRGGEAAAFQAEQQSWIQRNLK